MGDQVVKTIRNASKIGEEQFKSFVEGRFIDVLEHLETTRRVDLVWDVYKMIH
jgi:hypothetical protein